MTYVLNGAVYIVRTSHFLRTKKIVDVDTIGMEMNRKASLDIDTFGDLETASKLMEAQDEIR
jgi:CMP-N-acetylneuraminic acid synthetase